jgi:serine/threonine protein phosphatase PrpC
MKTHSLASSSIPVSVLNKVGVSVVRLVANYGTAGNQVTCTALGTLIASQAPSPLTPHFENWVLTDGNLVNNTLTRCGKLGDPLALNTIQVWNSSEYASGRTAPLGTLTCTDGSVRCTDGLASSVLDPLVFSDPGAPAAYTLFSFQSVAGEPFVELATASDENMTWNVGLTQTSGMVYPSKTVSGKDGANASINTYLTPSMVADPPAVANTGTPDASASETTNAIEGGTPEINAQGQLVGMWANNGNGGYTSISSSALSTTLQRNGVLMPATPVPSTQNCGVAACWNAGIDAFYHSPATQATYTQAKEDLSKASTLNPQFLAAQQFAALAQQHLSVAASKSDGASASSESNLLDLVNRYQLPLIAAGVVILLLLVLVLVLIARAQRRRRALAQFDAEVAESRRIAAEREAQRQRTQQGKAPTCPNCHNSVQVTDSICPYCRFPLAPTASGLGVRLMGNAPVATSPLPPSSAAISEQPTVLFPPNPPATPSADLGDTTIPGQSARAQEDATQDIQQVRGYNLSLAVGTRSDPGIKRKHKPNEDSLFAMQGARTHNSRPQQFGLFVVADGMGGHANGQDASRLAIQTMIDFMLPKVSNGEQMNDEAFLKLMGDGVQASNQAVHGRNMESHADMGTTMTAALVIGSTAYVANVGDSRTYLYREGQGLSKVTQDHSVVASLVEAGIIKPDDIYTHPKRNQIYRSLGEKPVVEVDTFKVDLLPGDKLLLCSDGLWDMVRDPLIQDVLGKPAEDPNETGQKLIKAALNGGGEDNVSVIVVQFAEMNEHTGMTGVQLLAKPESVTVPNLPTM